MVDWKTGSVPEPAKRTSLIVQLAAYRIAWAQLAGVPVEKVRAAFHYVRSGETLEPDDLPDRDALAALLAKSSQGSQSRPACLRNRRRVLDSKVL